MHRCTARFHRRSSSLSGPRSRQARPTHTPGGRNAAASSSSRGATPPAAASRLDAAADYYSLRFKE
jgi:hypothetical protein